MKSKPPDPEAAVSAPGTSAAMRDLGALARAEFAGARQALAALDWRILRPALLMMGVYEEYLARLERAGWVMEGRPVALSGWRKAMIAARWYVAPKLKVGTE